MKLKISDLWRLDGVTDRKSYFLWGMLLMAVKFNLDRILAAVVFQGDFTHWTGILNLYLWHLVTEPVDLAFYQAFLLTSLPFAGAGVVLTIRRLRSLGWRPWWVLLFFVPVVKLFFFALLCSLRSQGERGQPEAIREPAMLAKIIPQSIWGSCAMAVSITALLAVLLTLLGTTVFKDYGLALFIGLPFFMGFLSVMIHGFRQRHNLLTCFLVANGTVVVVGVALILFAIEGAICLIMAAPIAFALASLGGLVAYGVQDMLWWKRDATQVYCSAIMVFPLVMLVENATPPTAPLLKVQTSVIIAATPEKVWKNVVTFSELPAPNELMFKLGVAYPMCARIEGSGVGAIRYCDFSTGPFVEPIEVWDETRLLKFSVTHNPPPLEEWTPYDEVHPPHLEGFLESNGGQFRLERLADGSTLLEGTTWYYHHLWPASYWQVWSDKIIHTIHLRVLNHIKDISEKK